MTLTSQGDVTNVIDQTLKIVDDVFRQTNLSTSQSKDGLRIQTRLQTIFNLKSDAHASLIQQTLLTHALQAEKLGPGGSERCIENVLSLWKGKTTIESLKSVLDVIEKEGTTPAKGRHLVSLVSSLPQELRVLVQTSLDLCGFGGRIFVEKSESEKCSVELITGFSYALAPLFPVHTTLIEPRIACIDGFVESVSELHALLTSFVDSKSTGLLFVRGLHDDVKQTLKVNNDRGILKVYPFIVPFDLEGINTLADLATLSNGDVVSSNKGQLISSLTIADLPMIEKATVFNDRVVLINRSSKQRVKAHINHLKEKRASYSDDTLTKLIDLRIRALSPNQVMIRLPNNERYAVDAQAIDRTLRNIRTTIEHGITQEKPAATIVAGTLHAIKCWETLGSIGALITP